MRDAECPYCREDVDICHDDGYGYEEDKTYEQECSCCGNHFAYTTSIMFYYETAKAHCLNGGECKFKATFTVPRIATKMECRDCGARRNPTKEEMAEILKDEETK